jgi:ADP-heptose:LPS heptosyltransferase
MTREYSTSIGSGGGIGDCIWEFSVLPHLKITNPDCSIRLYLEKDFLYPLIEGLYDEAVPTEEFGMPRMFFQHAPRWRKGGWIHLMDLLPDTINVHYDVNIDHYYKMPYSRFFIDGFHPNNYYICFCTRTSVKIDNHKRNLPIETFYKIINNVDCQFIQIGEMDDDLIDLPNVIDKRGVPFMDTVSIIANAGMFYGLQSGLRIIAESLGTPLVCYHNMAYSTYDLPLTKYHTHCIFGDTPQITYPDESIAIIRDMIEKSMPYFDGCKDVARCSTEAEVDVVPENYTVVVDWKNLPLEIYAKTVAMHKPIRVFLEKK